MQARNISLSTRNNPKTTSSPRPFALGVGGVNNISPSRKQVTLARLDPPSFARDLSISLRHKFQLALEVAAYPAGGDFTTSQEINYSSSQLCGPTTEPSIIHAVTMRIVSPPDSISYVHRADFYSFITLSG